MFKGVAPILRFIVIALCLELPLIWSFFWMTGDFSVQRFNVWPISEWLINYQAGFIRRGLIGELLLKFFSASGLISALYIGMFISYAVFVVCFVWVYLKSQVRDSSILLIAILIQGGLFHMGMSSDFYTRKESLFLIFFAVQCLLYLQIKSLPEQRQSYWIYFYILLLLVVSPILVLIHEAYLFMGYPISALLLWILSGESSSHRGLKISSFILFFEVLIAFLICSHFHGDILMSQVIWDSLPFADRLLLSPSAPYSSFGAIASLGWNLDQHLTTLYGVFSSGGVVVWIFFGAGNAGVLAFIYLAIRSNKDGKLPLHYLRRVFIAAALLLPMFVVASDWGRWISTISNQLILFMFTLQYQGFTLVSEPKLNRKALAEGGWSRGLLVTFVVCIVYELLFRMPECCAYYTDIFPPFDQYWKLFFGT